MNRLRKWNLVWVTGVIGIILNVLLSLIAFAFATQTTKHPNGAASLDAWSRFKALSVSLFMTSLIVFIAVALSTAIALALPLIEDGVSDVRNSIKKSTFSKHSQR